MPDVSPRDEFRDAVAGTRDTRAPTRRVGTARRAARIALWGAASFLLNLAELLAEVVAPLVLVVGLAWWAGLRVIGAVALDPAFQAVLDQLPAQLAVQGRTLTPTGLIRDGVLLMAVVAACRTLSGIIARES